MKQLLVKFVLLFLSISLVACSSNTQSQNTGIGAVTGAVVGGLAGSAIGAGAGQAVAIGVGAIAGALIGGAIGKSMDSSDNARTYSALDNNAPHKATRWKNTKTGAVYTVVPGKRVTVNGNPNCRHYRTTAVVNGKKQHVYGTACRQANGTWMTV